MFSYFYPTFHVSFHCLLFLKQHIMSRLYDFKKTLGGCYPFPNSPVGKRVKCGCCLHGYMALTWMCLTWLLRLGKLHLAPSVFLAHMDKHTNRQMTAYDTQSCISLMGKHHLSNTDITEVFKRFRVFYFTVWNNVPSII